MCLECYTLKPLYRSTTFENGTKIGGVLIN